MLEDRPEMFFLVFVLPSLFAISLMAEGFWKISRNMSGWLNIFLGFAFLAASIFGYFAVFR